MTICSQCVEVDYAVPFNLCNNHAQTLLDIANAELERIPQAIPEKTQQAQLVVWLELLVSLRTQRVLP